MRRTVITTAAALTAILCFISPSEGEQITSGKTKIDDPTLLIDKLKEAVGDKTGSERVSISFSEEEELHNEFVEVCKWMVEVFNLLT
jgi:hypothetical protein